MDGWMDEALGGVDGVDGIGISNKKKFMDRLLYKYYSSVDTSTQVGKVDRYLSTYLLYGTHNRYRRALIRERKKKGLLF